MADAAAGEPVGIFFNCPFDTDYKPIFHALVFAAFDCGFWPRCALEIDDGAQTRISKIIAIMKQCPLGVHDISRTELDAATQLPRFNMPFELGLFIGARAFGGPDQRRKSCLILDVAPCRYQKFLSDIAGQDIQAHGGQTEAAIQALRRWLSTVARDRRLPGDQAIIGRHRAFLRALPLILRGMELAEAEMTFADFAHIASGWLREQPRTG